MNNFVKILTHLLLFFTLLMNPVWAIEGGSTSSQYSEANSCREQMQAEVSKCEGSNNRKWNCVMNDCVQDKDNKLFNAKYEQCNNYSEPSQQASCKAELKTIGNEVKSTNSNTLKSEDFKVTEGGEAVKTIAGGLIGAVVSSMICPAPSPSSPTVAYIGAGISVVASIWNHTQAKKKMEKHQKEYKKLVAEMETNGMSVEIQIRVFRLMIQALKDMEKIADNKYKKHLIVTILYAAATAIAYVEADIYPFMFTACSLFNVGALALGTALEMKEMMKAKKMMSDYASRREAVETILKRFEDALLKGGVSLPTPPASELAKNNEQEAINTKSASSEEELTQAQKDALLAANKEDAKKDRVCLSKDRVEDISCSCKESNSCYKVDPSIVKSLGQIGEDYAKASNFSSIVNNANQLTSGNTDLSELNTEKLEGNLALAMGMKKFVLKKINEQRKLRGDSEISDEPDYKKLEKALNDMSPLERALASRYDESSFSADSFIQEGLSKAVDSTQKTASALAKIKDPKVLNAVKAIDIEGLKRSLLQTSDLNTKEMDQTQMAANSGVSEELNENEIEIKNKDIIQKPEASLFKVISNRYNLMRLEKRIGY